MPEDIKLEGARSIAVALPEHCEDRMIEDLEKKKDNAVSYLMVGEKAMAEENKAALVNVFNLLARLSGKFEVVALKYEPAKDNAPRLTAFR